MLESIERIEEYTGGMGFEEFMEINSCRMPWLENIPEEIRNKKPEIE